ncbi:50S ribosomal protein L17 [Candidatus Dojkabacteria bacterium]|uniref:50S ribosomal protein L17 n=1 Tax=Candidatus Dojkabacteria bacterium TaxID=2099670 RepID=A0A955L6B8_9BACT|nr:50S ribosomal protein L17 [Candidatus Dojkabacteria bacterium]
MNNKRKVAKLGRAKAHRTAAVRNLVTNLVIYEHMKTTPAKAKALMPVFDKVVKLAKSENKNLARKKLSNILFGDNAIDKALEVFSKRFEKEDSGFVQKFKVGTRPGDNADMVMLLVKGYEYKEVGKKTKKAVKKEDKKNAQDTKDVKKQNLVDDSKNLSNQVNSGSQGRAKSRSGI